MATISFFSLYFYIYISFFFDFYAMHFFILHELEIINTTKNITIKNWIFFLSYYSIHTHIHTIYILSSSINDDYETGIKK